MDNLRLRCDEWTHAELVDAAAWWLRHTMKVALVLTERGTTRRCDVIGWRGLWSHVPGCVVVECKRSRSDFKADLMKSGRHERWEESSDLGDERWYFAPPGIIPIEYLPPKWGLVEFDGSVCRVRVKPQPFVLDRIALRSQVLTLARELRAFQAQGITARTFSEQTDDAAAREADRAEVLSSMGVLS